jgi:guanylate kinase
VERRARLFVVSGPSGVGKGTLVSRVRDRIPNLGLTVSATTRDPRAGEIPDVSYHFITEDEFERLVAEGAFLEWDGHFGSHYGTLWSEVNPHLEQGNSVILEIDVKGAFNVRKALPEAVLIFVAPPSLEELEARLRGRGAENEAQIAQRLERVEMEMGYAPQYDEILVNDDLDQATSALEELIRHYETDGGTDQDGNH